MICPYRDEKHVQLMHEKPIEVEGTQEIRNVTTTVFVPYECAKENCAAWRNGRCEYKGI